MSTVMSYLGHVQDYRSKAWQMSSSLSRFTAQTVTLGDRSSVPGKLTHFRVVDSVERPTARCYNSRSLSS